MRIPVRFVHPRPESPPAGQALLLPLDADDAPPGVVPPGWIVVLRLPPVLDAIPHAAGCACCAPGPPAATVLAHLFQQRARGEVGFFHAVVASLPQPQAAMLRRLLRSDRVLCARFVGVD